MRMVSSPELEYESSVDESDAAEQARLYGEQQARIHEVSRTKTYAERIAEIKAKEIQRQAEREMAEAYEAPSKPSYSYKVFDTSTYSPY